MLCDPSVSRRGGRALLECCFGKSTATLPQCQLPSQPLTCSMYTAALSCILDHLLIHAPPLARRSPAPAPDTGPPCIDPDFPDFRTDPPAPAPLRLCLLAPARVRTCAATSGNFHFHVLTFPLSAQPESTRRALAQYWVDLPQPDHVAARVAAQVAGALPPGPLADTVRHDAARLAVAMNHMVGGLPNGELTATLEVVGWNRCSRWHMDAYAGRFVVTYGWHAGTVFVSDPDVDFAAFRAGQLDNNVVVKDPAAAVSAPPAAMALIKGKMWPGLGGAGAVHRSPDVPAAPLTGRLPHRLLLKVDVMPRNDCGGGCAGR